MFNVWAVISTYPGIRRISRPFYYLYAGMQIAGSINANGLKPILIKCFISDIASKNSSRSSVPHNHALLSSPQTMVSVILSLSGDMIYKPSEDTTKRYRYDLWSIAIILRCFTSVVSFIVDRL